MRGRQQLSYNTKTYYNIYFLYKINLDKINKYKQIVSWKNATKILLEKESKQLMLK